MSQERARWGSSKPTEEGQPLPVLLKSAVFEAVDLAKAELELVKAKAIQSGKKLAVGIAFFAVAAFMGIFLLWWLFHSVELAFALILPGWAASLITAGILLVLALFFVLLGGVFIKVARKDAPPVHEIVESNAEIVKEGFEQ